ncbi:hypothetical protein CYMTET_49768 [Cymbomonas tetramitiformis]|uniref:Uncharacterized protein n=1 Tax=Cymbomonas tetramitiformis TaxID=36881 RepID=A0AAE0BPL1_9CHLO|nr:hypothetical protein CYMTET_49768 [Cymbomonas tetramitiformis]
MPVLRESSIADIAVIGEFSVAADVCIAVEVVARCSQCVLSERGEGVCLPQLDVNASWHAADAEMSGHFARSDFFKQKWSCVKDAARELICRYHRDTASKNARVSTTVHDYI